MIELELGKWYQVSGELVKKKIGNDVIQSRISYFNKKKMMFVGLRTVPSGNIDHEYFGDYERVSTFIPTEFHRVALMIESKFKNPVRVPLSDIEAYNDRT